MTYQPFHQFGLDRPGRWVITSDHATNTVPPVVPGSSLGISAADMERHIAYDIGAKGLARALGEALDSSVICSNFSRLVIDPNRGIDDPTLLMKLYDGTIIPGNRTAGPEELAARKAACYDPYHDALSTLMARKGAVLLSVHSFTPKLSGRPMRPWEVGILSAHDRRLADPLLDLLEAKTDMIVGDNEPYAGHLPGDAVDRHALQYERLNALIEVRQDLIGNPAQQAAWAQRLAPLLEEALRRTNL